MDSSRNISYMALGLVGEVGELTSKLAKAIRKENIYIGREKDSDLHYDLQKIDGDKLYEWEEGLKAELGDVLWFCAGVAEVMGWNLEDIAKGNIDKLASRQNRGVIEGDGDNR